MRLLKLNPVLLALILTVALFFLGGILRPGFASYGQATSILRLAAFLGIIAAGQTLVILSGYEGIDLSVGANVTLGAIIVFRLSDGANEMFLPALAIALAAGLLIGTLNGIGVTVFRIPPLVMTLGMAGVVQGLILVITRGQMIGETPPIVTKIFSESIIFGISNTVFIWILMGALMWILLNRTPYGKKLYAIGANRTAARLSGVRVPWMVTSTFALSGMLSAFGGFVLLSYTETVFLNLGGPYLLPSVAAVVVGGTPLSGGQGGYMGTIAGALLLTVIDSLLTTLQLPEFARQVFYGAILLLLLLGYGRQKALRQ